MRRVLVLAASAVLLGAGAGGALAASNGGGNSQSAPGQAKAHANCVAVLGKQAAKDLHAGGGPKSHEPTSPTNCDHFWQDIGSIGKDKL